MKPRRTFYSLSGILSRADEVEDLSLSASTKKEQLKALPDTLLSLPNLRSLRLSGHPDLTLPDFMGELTGLEELYINRCPRITTLPEAVIRLPGLRAVGWSDTSSVDAVLERLQDAPALRAVNLNVEGLTRLPANLTALRRLQRVVIFRPDVLDLDVMADSLAQLTDLRRLNLVLLTRALPEGLGRLAALEEIDIWGGHGGTSGGFPDSIGRLTKLRRIKTNRYSFPRFPDALCALPALQEIDVDYGNMEALPEDIGRLSTLTTLIATHNRLTRLPDSICRCTALEVLHLWANALTALPENIGNLSRLCKLGLNANNDLHTLPDSFNLLRSLEELELPSSLQKVAPDLVRPQALTGLKNLRWPYPLPAGIGGLKALSTLDTKTPLPADIVGCTALADLWLRLQEGHSFSEAAVLLGRLPALKTVRLDFKPGISSAGLGHLTQVESLTLHGPVSDSLGKMASLKTLKLSWTGGRRLPESLGDLSELEELIVSHNRLETLPESIGRLKKLRRIEAYNNGMTTLPDSIGGAEALEELLVAANEITRIPPSVGNLKRLRVVELRQRETMDLAATFSILAGCTSLAVLDLSYDHKLTTLPAELGLLTSLETLNCSDTHLTSVPAEIGQLTRLRSIRFSYFYTDPAQRKAIKKALPGKGWKQHRSGDGVELRRAI